MVDLVTPRYKGDVRPVDSRSDDYLPYLPSKELKDAVNLTILLETRPLLIKGEPGSNKTPIVFITSNDEKDLPDAFLRRCLFYYIKFPDPDQLTAIVNAHFPHSSKTLVQKAIKRFMQLREQMGEKKTGKKVSTSELIDWFRILSSYPKDEVLAQLQGQLPYPAALLKSW